MATADALPAVEAQALAALRCALDTRRTSDPAELDLPTDASGPWQRLDPAAAERAVDAVRGDRVTRIVADASSAPRGAEGEVARRALRLVAPWWLGRAVLEIDAELRERLGRSPFGPRELERRMVASDDPAEIVTLHRAWLTTLSELERCLESRRSRLDAAARDAGSPDSRALLGSCSPEDPERTLAAFERSAIAPLDDGIARALRDRLAGTRLPSPAVAVRLAGLAEHAAALEPAQVVRSAARVAASRPARRLGAVVRFGEPRGIEAGSLPFAEAPTVVPAATGGPAALWSVLGATGACLRAAVTRCRRGDVAALACDPALDAAARTLFRRLALSSRFLDSAGLPAAPGAEAVALLEALAPRRAWADAAADPDAAWRRAVGLDPTPTERLRRATPSPAGSDTLRGTVLGLLLEDRLLRRHGWTWFLERRALEELVELWEAEPEQTAESVAAALSLGTIEPTPIVDACRPPA